MLKRLPMPNEEKLRLLKKACRRGRFDFDETIQKCRDGRNQFWDIDNAVAVTTLLVSGETRTCFIVAMAGTLDGMKAMDDMIEEWAKGQGCDFVRACIRPSLVNKERSKYRYKAIGIMAEKDIRHG